MRNRVSQSGVADAPPGNWVDRLLPAMLLPYARLSRLDRPIGWWLLAFPCWWSAALAAGGQANGLPGIGPMLAFLLGAIVMRGAGCTYNDLVDRDIDAKVARTRSRPIPSGQISPMRAALWLGVQLLLGLVALLTFNRTTIIAGFASLGLVAAYPFMKRITDWPQLFLGLTFSWGALLGWTAMRDSLGAPALLLYAGGVLWTIGYDTIYALQDVEDDALIGVRSTARLFAGKTPFWVGGFYAGASLCFTASFLAASAGPWAFAGLALGAGQLAWQVTRLKGAAPVLALKLFRSNRWFGWIFLVGLLIDGAF